MENINKLPKVFISRLQTTWKGLNYDTESFYKILGLSLCLLLAKSLKTLLDKWGVQIAPDGTFTLSKEQEALLKKECLKWAAAPELNLFLSYMEREKGKDYNDFRQIVSFAVENFNNQFDEDKEKEIFSRFSILATIDEKEIINLSLSVLSDCEEVSIQVSSTSETTSEVNKADTLSAEELNIIIQSWINLGKVAMQLIVLFEILNPIRKIYEDYGKETITFYDFLKKEPDEYIAVDDSDFYKMLVELADDDQQAVISHLLLIAPGHRTGEWKKVIEEGEEAFLELLSSTTLDGQAFNKLANRLKEYYRLAKFYRTINKLDATNIDKFVEEAKDLSIPELNPMAQAIRVLITEFDKAEPDYEKLSVAAETAEIKFKESNQETFKSIFEYLSDAPEPLMKMQIEKVLNKEEYKSLVDGFRNDIKKAVSKKKRLVSNFMPQNLNEHKLLLLDTCLKPFFANGDKISQLFGNNPKEILWIGKEDTFIFLVRELFKRNDDGTWSDIQIPKGLWERCSKYVFFGEKNNKPQIRK